MKKSMSTDPTARVNTELDLCRVLYDVAVASEAEDEHFLQDTDKNQEIELALKKVRLELLRRKEMALVEMQRIVAEYRLNNKSSKKPELIS